VLLQYRYIAIAFFAANSLSFCRTGTGTTTPATSLSFPSDTAYFITTRELKSDKIPDSVFQLINLKHLAVSGMDCDYGDHKHCWGIREIPAAIKNLSALTSLSLTINAIQVLPAELATLKQLKVLDLTDNAGLGSCEILTELTTLETLNLYGCGLTHLPAAIGNLVHLRELGVAGNYFDEKEKERIREALPHCRIIF
jgi:hypothetical protein